MSSSLLRRLRLQEQMQELGVDGPPITEHDEAVVQCVVGHYDKQAKPGRQLYLALIADPAEYKRIAKGREG